jgi:hypothetical protein
MEPRAMILGALGGINSVLFFICHISLTENPGSGPEGIGTALLMLATVFFSAILSAFALKILYQEYRMRSLEGMAILAGMLAVAPLVFYLVVDVLPYRR